MCMWSQQPGHLFLRRPGPEDLDQCEAEDELNSIMSALARLRLRYTTQHHQHKLQRTQATQGCSATQQGVFGWGSRIWGSICNSWAHQKHATPKEQTNTGCTHNRPQRPVNISRVHAVGTDHRIGMDLMWLAELLHIWRPVIYVSMLHRRGRDCWYPWLTSLLVDLLSMHFTYRGKALTTRDMAPSQPVCFNGDIARQESQQQQYGDAPGWPTGHSVHLNPPGTSLLSLALVR